MAIELNECEGLPWCELIANQPDLAEYAEGAVSKQGWGSSAVEVCRWEGIAGALL